MAVQPLLLPLDALFAGPSHATAEAPTAPQAAVTDEPRARRFSGVGRTVIAIAAAGVFFGGAGSAYMHASMGHMVMGGDSSTSSTTSMTGAKADTMGGTGAMTAQAPMAAPAAPVEMPSGADAGPPRKLGEGTAMAASSAAAAAAAPKAAAAPAPAVTTAPRVTSSSSARSSASSSSGTAAANPVRRYTVGEGDSFGSFAARYGVSEARIQALNPGVDSTALTIGQTLRVQ